MSAILDALRKSDRERRLGQTPTLDDGPTETAPSRSRGWLLLVLLLLVIALGAGLLWQNDRWKKVARMAGLMPRSAPQTQPVDADNSAAAEMAGSVVDADISEPEAAVALEPAPSTQPAGPTTAQTRPRPTAQPDVERPTQPQATAPREQPTPTADRNPFVPAPTRDVTTNPVTQIPPATQSRPKPKPEPQRPPSDDYRRTYQLPLDVRRQLPNLTMNAHMYAPEAEERVVLLNMKRLSEGDELEGVKITEIRPDGVVLDFLGYQFLIDR